MTLMGAYEGYFAIGGVFLFIIAIIWVLMKTGTSRRLRRARHGTGRQKRLLSMVGGPSEEIEKKTEKLEDTAQLGEQDVKKDVADEQLEEKKEKKEGVTGSELEIDEAAEAGGRGAAETEEAEEDIEGITEEENVLTACAREILNALIAFVVKVIALSEKEEEKMLPALEALTEKLEGLKNFNKIDAESLAFVKEVVKEFEKATKAIVDDEQAKEEGMKNVVLQAKIGVNTMGDTVKGAMTLLGDLKKREGAVRKDFDKDISKFGKALKDKRKELKRARKEAKGAGGQILASIQNEIATYEKQESSAKNINNQLKQTYKTMDNEISQMRKLLQKVRGAARSMRRWERKVQRREKDVEKRWGKLSEAQQKIAEHAEKEIAMPQLLVALLAQDTGKFFGQLVELIKEDIRFSKQLKTIAIQNVIMGQQMVAFTKLSEGLAESEEAVQKGGEAILALTAGVAGDQEVQVDEQKITADLEASRKRIDYEKTIEVYLEQMETKVEQQSAAVAGQIDKLIEIDEKTIAETEAENKEKQEHLGKTVASIAATKEAAGQWSTKMAEDYGDQLKKRNEIAAASYKRARKFEKHAAAA